MIKIWNRNTRKGPNWRDLPGVTGVLFERKAQQSDLFPGNSVEETVNDSAGKALPLVLVHVYNLSRIGIGRWEEGENGELSAPTRCRSVSFSPAASRKPPQAGWGPRTDTPDSAHLSGNSFHRNLVRVSENIHLGSTAMKFIQSLGRDAVKYE